VFSQRPQWQQQALHEGAAIARQTLPPPHSLTASIKASPVAKQQPHGYFPHIKKKRPKI